MGRSSKAGALATTTFLALGLMVITPAAPAIAEAGTAPHEVTVLPPGDPTVRAQEYLVLAGRTGFLHRHNNSLDYLWTRYDTRATVVVKELAGLNPVSLKNAGGDRLAITAQVPARPAPGKVSVLDLSDQSWQQWTVPSGYTLLGIYGQTMVLRKAVSGLVLELRTFATDGTSTATPVTGVPEGAAYAAVTPIGDAESVVVPYRFADQTVGNGLLDIASATMVPIRQATSISAAWRLSGDTLAWTNLGSGTFHVHSRTAVRAGDDSVPKVVQLPAGDPNATSTRFAFVGGHLLITRNAVANTTDWHPTLAVPVDGGAATTALAQTGRDLNGVLQGPDGTALVIGGTGSRDWAAHRFSVAGGAPTGAMVLPVADPVKNAGLTFEQSLVRHLQTQVNPADGRTQYAIFNRALVPGARTIRDGVLAANATPCATGVECVRLVDGNAYGVTYLLTGSTNGTDSVRSFVSGDTSYVTTGLATKSGRIVDVGDGYVIVNDGASYTQFVVDIGHSNVVRTRPATGAALWYDTLWTAAKGYVQASRLPTGETVRTVSTGTACTPSEVRTSARWLYWTCGISGPAGVYDLTLNRNLTVPGGPILLGDGFLVRQDTATASLMMSDFHDGTLRAPVKLADLPVGRPTDGRGITWAVDRHGAGVAYVDAGNAVHVIDTGVPSTAPAIGSGRTNGLSYPRAEGLDKYWTGSFRPTRPLWSWELSIAEEKTGAVVATSSGGPVHDYFATSWDGRLASGAPAVNGTYRWTLTGRATEGGPAAEVGSGYLQVVCGTFAFRSYSCYGGSGLLAVKPDGEGHWYGEPYGAVPAGRLWDNGSTERWCLSCVDGTRASALVPFGDFDGDGLPDLLVRDGVGVLRAYLGIGQMHYDKDSLQSLSLGKGWMTYRSLLAPGDVNSDGHDDLLGVDNDGRLWLYTTTGSGSINPRVQVGTSWGIYPRVIGAGDLNGDGRGDLLGIDKTGVMYRYFGDGRGYFGARVQVSTGWNVYNAVVPIGDLNYDGKVDLVARDTAGVLWFHAGLGNGGFAARTKQSSGWNIYQVIA